MKCKYSNAPEQIAWRQVSISGSFWEKKKKKWIRQTSIRKGLSWTYPVPEQGDLTVHQSTAPALFSLLFYFCSQPSHRFRWLFNCGQPWISSSFPGADFRMRFSFIPIKVKIQLQGKQCYAMLPQAHGQGGQRVESLPGNIMEGPGSRLGFPNDLKAQNLFLLFSSEDFQWKPFGCNTMEVTMIKVYKHPNKVPWS